MYLDMHGLIIIHEVKYSGEIFQLCMPFTTLIKTKVITEHEQHMIVSEELGFTSQLIKQVTCPQLTNQCSKLIKNTPFILRQSSTGLEKNVTVHDTSYLANNCVTITDF